MRSRSIVVHSNDTPHPPLSCKGRGNTHVRDLLVFSLHRRGGEDKGEGALDAAIEERFS
jgi:hypothetical protein